MTFHLPSHRLQPQRIWGQPSLRDAHGRLAFDDLLLRIAQENAVAETAYLKRMDQGVYALRWFTRTWRWTSADTPHWPLPTWC